MIDKNEWKKRISPKKQQKLETLFANAPQFLMKNGTFVKIEKNTTFIDTDKDALSIYILVDGRVKAADYRMNEVVYDYTWFEPIELFGAMEFYMGCKKYITTLITMTDCVMITFPNSVFRRWIENDVSTILKQVKVMMHRLNDQGRKERSFMFLSSQERLMYLLTQIYHEHGRDGEECAILMTQEDLANHSGINLRTATRAIQQLCKEGKLTRRARKLYISKSQCMQMEEELKAIVDGGYDKNGKEENNFRL